MALADPFLGAFHAAKGEKFGHYDDHTQPHRSMTVPQLTLLIVWMGALCLFILRIVTGTRDKLKIISDETNETQSNGKLLSELPKDTEKDSAAEKLESVILSVEKELADAAHESKNDASKTSETLVPPNEDQKEDTKSRTVDEKNPNVEVSVTKTQDKVNKPEKLFSKIKPPPTFDTFLGYIIILGFILFFFYLTDYKKIFQNGTRTYSRDTFLFFIFLLFLVGCAFTIKPTQDIILNRDQTEEWKGWMQVMFVWYHYFAAKEWYSWIRIYIAAYVWMTGFGNFSFFWIKKDYSAWRVIKMLFRLNFLVLLVCATVNNEYMLYYICAMHTYWFLSVYALMAVLPSWNTERWKMITKFAVYAIFNALIFDIPGVCSTLFRPISFLMEFHDGVHDPMHEWEFRAGLDHWAAFIGMLCAYNYPHFEAFMKQLESASQTVQERWWKLGKKFIIAGLMTLVLIMWHESLMHKDKFGYNAIHPYTSFIPIIAFIVLRNLFPLLRSYYVHMFAWLGKITLETYLSQLHIYLQSNAKNLIIYIPGYDLLNFALSNIIYLGISYALFSLTTEFSAYLFPNNYRTIGKNALLTLVIFTASGLLAYFLKSSNMF